MVDIPRPPKSPTLQPPRKSVELEDPGAHELGRSERNVGTRLVNCMLIHFYEGSDNDEDVFADAQEGQKISSEANSGPHSPVPITRVEKVNLDLLGAKIRNLLN